MKYNIRKICSDETWTYDRLVMVGENIFEKKVISPNTMVTQYFLYQQSYNEYPDQFTLV